MDQLVQCPVCTLYLHNGMSLESHLDTHPKDQVIKALCNLTTKNTFANRTQTPLHSERSYRSRSRTPSNDDRWNGAHRNSEHDRYWRKPPSRTKSTIVPSLTRHGTPDIRTGDPINFEPGPVAPGQHSAPAYFIKSDIISQSYQNAVLSDFEQPYGYYQEHQEDKEIKFSRSADYTPMDSTNSVFTYNIPPIVSGLKQQTNNSLLPTSSKKSPDFVKILPKPNNILVKANGGGMQYITPGVKPMNMMVPSPPTFVHKNLQNNMIIPGSVTSTQVQIEPKPVTSQLSNQFNQLSTGTFTPGLSTVVTQNSQLIYREMVHNIEGKPYISSMPAVITTGPDNVTNAVQGNHMYQNVMVVDQFGSCMYTTPQQLLPKSCTTPIYSDTGSESSSTHISNSPMTPDNDPKTLIIEVGPIVPPESISCNTVTSCSTPPDSSNDKSDISMVSVNETLHPKVESPGITKGLKILSNIKVEVPVQHHKNMINTIMDLTGSNDLDYTEKQCSESPEKILPDFDDRIQNTDDCTQPSTSSNDSIVSHSFSVIKNVGKPTLHKEASNKTETRLDTEFADSCPVPDLICNEKPSISPCSELSEHGDDSTDRTSISLKLEREKTQTTKNTEQVQRKPKNPSKPYKANSLRLNNLYVKKNKKVLQIKNAKSVSTSSSSQPSPEPVASSSNCKSPEHFIINKINQSENRESSETLQSMCVEEIKEVDDNDQFDADTEEQSMDLEPVAPSTLSTSHEFTTNVDMVHVKEEINTSNEGAFCNETIKSDSVLTPLESLRPVNVISYGNLSNDNFNDEDDESTQRELLDLEVASKSKQFVNMMNENYFGDNMYADYFTPDRLESFATNKDTAPKDPIYGIWGESSQKVNEFVLPNFIHESYKVTENTPVVFPEIGERSERGDGEADGCERDIKADVLSESRSDGEPPLNICADERMPPRGELSGQESNGDMESPWSGMYTEVTPSEPYDLIARESWVSDGSEVDPNEKRDLAEDLQFPKSRSHLCSQCGAKFPALKELRAHKAQAHAHAHTHPHTHPHTHTHALAHVLAPAPLACSTKTSYRRLVTARAIKKEVKIDDNVMPCSLITVDSKESITTTILQGYDMDDAKSNIEGLIKQEAKRRRKDFVCPTCKVDQVTDKAFHAHLRVHPLECLTCGKCFFRRANLALHMKAHLGIKNYKCEVCEKRFLTRQKLSEHQNVHTGRTPVKCTVCDGTFRRYSNMVQHRDRHHLQKRGKVRDFVCSCGLVFHSRAKLHWHKETHEERPKACLYCSDKFVHAASLTRHVRRAHNEYYLSTRAKGKVDNVPCPVCKQVYLRTNLRSHLQTHSGKKPYVCIICNKSFTTKWNLKLHRWTHMSRSTKPYKCHLCKAAFIRHTEYVSHMNAHKAVKPYTCNYCGCQFIRKYNCQRHVREHEMAKKYTCKVAECGKSFHRSYYLAEHMKVHSGARPFACNICGKTSSNKSNHNKHVKIHHAREPLATEA